MRATALRHDHVLAAAVDARRVDVAHQPVVADEDGAARLPVGDGDVVDVDHGTAGVLDDLAVGLFHPQVADARHIAARIERFGELDDGSFALADARHVGVLE